MDYATIKALAATAGRRVSAFFVLAPQNDPFYVGAPASRRDGEWFAQQWAACGYGGAAAVHLRRVHYRLISGEPVALPEGGAYENTEHCWQRLAAASKAARYLGLVPAEAFSDQRNPDPQHFAREDAGPLVASVTPDEWGDLGWAVPEAPAWPRLSVSGYQGRQAYDLEVWCEKSTVNDVLIPLCRRYGATLQVGVGEQSITAALALATRAADRPVRVFYLSDFDPAGQSMPVAVARKVEFFLRARSDVDLQIMPLLLTRDQVVAYRLPRTPIKDSERRRGAFEARHGEGAVELDALEAVAPGTLRRLVDEALRKYYDETLDGRVSFAKFGLQQAIDEASDAARANLADEIAAVEADYQAAVARWEAAMAAVTARAAGLSGRLAVELEAQVAALLAEHPIPVPRPAVEWPDPLFDSRRDYFAQLAAYKRFQGKAAAEDAA